MITIDKAILHILDFNSGITVFSDNELPIEDSNTDFLLKHVEKSYNSQDAKPGDFYPDSEFEKKLDSYLTGGTDFVTFSKEVGQIFADAFGHTEEMTSADFIMADAKIDDIRKIVIFKCDNRIGYIHQANQTETGTVNEIKNHYAIMPSPKQKIDEFAFIDAETKKISASAKKYTIDGNSIFVLPELLLECSLEHSPKEALKSLNKTIKKVAESYGKNEVSLSAAAKSKVSETMQSSNELDLQAIGEKIFKDNPSMQQDFAESIKEQGFDKPVKMDQGSTIKKVCRHKLKTDTGIELVIPTDYMDSTEYVEFNNNEDGTLSITLKHISNIMSRN